MKLHAIATLSAAFTLLPATTALPHVDADVLGHSLLPREDRTIDGILVKDYHNDTITLALGTGARNIGTRRGPELYNELFSAIQVTAGKKTAKGAGVTIGDKSVPRASFEVFVAHGKDLAREKFHVYMQSAFWDGNHKIYDLLTKAVAGAAARTYDSEFNCYAWQGRNMDGSWAEYNFCNAVDMVNVGFANKYWMNVTFDSTRGSVESGTADCWAVREKAKQYVEENIAAKLDDVLAWPKDAAWVAAECEGNPTV